MDTACVPSDLKMYLPLLLEVLTESPIMREGSRFSSIFFHIVFLRSVQQGSHSTWKTWKNESTPGKPGNIMEFWKI